MHRKCKSRNLECDSELIFDLFSCEGCKGFFKRTVRKDLSYTCRHQGCCVIDKRLVCDRSWAGKHQQEMNIVSKEYFRQRNRCQHCRYQKCAEMGMKRDAVQEVPCTYLPIPTVSLPCTYRIPTIVLPYPFHCLHCTERMQLAFAAVRMKIRQLLSKSISSHPVKFRASSTKTLAGASIGQQVQASVDATRVSVLTRSARSSHLFPGRLPSVPIANVVTGHSRFRRPSHEGASDNAALR